MNEFTKSHNRSVQRRIDGAWKEGFTYGFILAVLACAIIEIFLRTL